MPYKDKEENRKYQREWARKNSKTRKENQISYARRKQIVDEAKSHSCIICNKEFPSVVMDLIHVDPSPQKYSVSKLLQFASYQTLKQEIDKCAPICANCHRLLENGLVDLPPLIMVP
jgi:phosphoglycerate-specific signal transduction histidine kinase